MVLYLPLTQEKAPVTAVVLSAAGNAAQVTANARAALKSLDPSIKIGATQPFRAVFDAGLGNERLLATIAVCFAALALLLSGVGVYGVLSYAVERRTQEIGIRIALGAGRPAVYRMIAHQAAVLVAISVAIGGGGAFALTRALRGMLFGFAPADYELPLVAAAILCVTALVAAWLPARRAASLDPMDAIR
jgi:ABC-type antimicrobial peptide transport system permease subunit